MPRSQNSVASRNKRKKYSNKLRATMVEEKMFGKQLKMLLKRDSYIHIETGKTKKDLLDYYG